MIQFLVKLLFCFGEVKQQFQVADCQQNEAYENYIILSLIGSTVAYDWLSIHLNENLNIRKELLDLTILGESSKNINPPLYRKKKYYCGGFSIIGNFDNEVITEIEICCKATIVAFKSVIKLQIFFQFFILLCVNIGKKSIHLSMYLKFLEFAFNLKLIDNKM